MKTLVALTLAVFAAAATSCGCEKEPYATWNNIELTKCTYEYDGDGNETFACCTYEYAGDCGYTLCRAEKCSDWEFQSSRCD